jgi:hypothetical protein
MPAADRPGAKFVPGGCDTHLVDMRLSLALCGQVTLALLLAAPAAAQDYLGLTLQRDAERVADAEAARQRDIATANQLSVVDALARTDQALRQIQAQSQSVPAPVVRPGGPAPVIDTRQLAAIPDAVLASSNARVRAAAANRK